MRVWLEASWARNCSRVHCVAGLSTLPDNPGDSRFWTISPGLQIRVWNLPHNRRSLPFLVRFDFRKMKFQIFCLIWAILLLILNDFSQIPVCRCNINNQCDWWEVNQLGQMLQFQQLLFRAYFFTNDVMCRALWRHLPSLPLWRRGGLTALHCYDNSVSGIHTGTATLITSHEPDILTMHVYTKGKAGWGAKTIETREINGIVNELSDLNKEAEKRNWFLKANRVPMIILSERLLASIVWSLTEPKFHLSTFC